MVRNRHKCVFRPSEAILVTAMWPGFLAQTMNPFAIASTACSSLWDLTLFFRTSSTLLLAIKLRFCGTLLTMPVWLLGQYVSNADSRQRREQPTTIGEAA